MFKMTEDSSLANVILSGPYLIRMGLSFSWMYITLGSRVRKARRAFEKQLIMQGMAKKDALRLSACFEDLKDSMTRMLRQGVARGF
jgi:hypothetical protein